ncbi:PCMD domain-containing protein [uncultured Alistipes sp.]|jgi:hypothetical protein|uniref:PCMD domain-containing protein n=1 Tax=uncultured Alistipes sp. TaxID=538949 RepID=UPI0025F000D6|nr:PCMD domain-containing protein [uncultured Alistipes sp.]
MKNLSRIFLCAAAVALTAAGCSKDETTGGNTPPKGEGKYISIQAEQLTKPESRANINVGEDWFTAEWEHGDAMGLLATPPGSDWPSEISEFTYNSADSKFSGLIPPGETGTWKYLAFYPHVDQKTNLTYPEIPFGNYRTQQGNAFNCASDPLVANELIYDAEGGLDEDGNDIKFKFKRLTSILNFNIGSSNTDEVAHLLLTSGNASQMLSAEKVTFGCGMGHETQLYTNGTDEMDFIVLGFEEGTAPTANDLKAFFNVLPGNYDALNLEVFTKTGKVGKLATVVRNADPFEAGVLYKKDVADLVFTDLEKPSLEWPGQEINNIHPIENIGNLYNASINISVPGGIAGLVVGIDSEILNTELGEDKLDLLNPEYRDFFNMLQLSNGKDIQYKKSCVFDITSLVPMITMLGPDPGSLHVFNVKVTDLAGQVTEQSLAFQVAGGASVAYNGDADFWTNKATMSISGVNESVNIEDIKLQYRILGQSKWNDATVTAGGAAGNFTASIAPTWDTGTNAGGHDIYTVDSKTGIFAKNKYQYQLIANEKPIYWGVFTPENNGGDAITQFVSGLSCFTSSNTAAEFWGSGNNSLAASLCTLNDGYAHMQANQIIGILAPGNLFTGTFTFVKQGLFGSTSYGTVGFGQKYTYTSRPTALQFRYKASFGSTVSTKYPHDNELKTGDHDQASFIVCIIDWDARHNVTSGNNGAPTGGWNPITLAGLSDDEKAGLIAYGVVYPQDDEANGKIINIPLNYYNKEAGIPQGNYTIIISCSTSRYGEYLNGTKNAVHVKDFQWVY